MTCKSEFYFRHPTTILIAGPTRSGKTQFVFQLLKNFLIQPFPNRIIWFYKEDQPLHSELKSLFPQVELQQNLQQSVFSSITTAEKNLVVIDDLMNTAADSKSVSDLFTQESHHRNMTVILIIQNLFYKGKEMRTISLNTHYFVLYKNPRDKTQIRYLAQQIYPDNPRFLVNSFNHATSQPHSYLIIDLHPATKEDFRVVTNILPSDQLRIYQQCPL